LIALATDGSLFGFARVTWDWSLSTLWRLKCLDFAKQLGIVDAELGVEVVVVLEHHLQVEQVFGVPRTSQVLGDDVHRLLASAVA
jgi:hypothetical protein